MHGPVHPESTPTEALRGLMVAGLLAEHQQTGAVGVQGPSLQLVQPLHGRLAEAQQQSLLVNYALLLLRAGRNDACQAIASALANR